MFDLRMYDGVLDDVPGGLLPHESLFIDKIADGQAELIYSCAENAEACARFAVDPDFKVFLTQLKSAVADMVTACRAHGVVVGATFIAGAKE